MSDLNYSGTKLYPSADHKKAADLMRTAISVDHWNRLRQAVKSTYPIEILYWIDQSGLIMEVV